MLPKTDVPILTRALRLLEETPYQTSWSLAQQLDEKTSTVSSLLYREMLRHNNRVTRRASPVEGRGFEWYIVGEQRRSLNE